MVEQIEAFERNDDKEAGDGGTRRVAREEADQAEGGQSFGKRTSGGGMPGNSSGNTVGLGGTLGVKVNRQEDAVRALVGRNSVLNILMRGSTHDFAE